MPYSAHCVWDHDIDSKGEGISDEGDMYMLPNGDCMEVGVDTGPATGKVYMYKEYWTGPDGTRKVRHRPCIVAKMTGQTGSGGMVIRIGDYCQGIVRQPAAKHDSHAVGTYSILVERWTRGLVEAEESSATTGSGWVQDWRSNTPGDTKPSMPCEWLLNDKRMLNDETVVDGITWTVVEAVLDEDGSVNM